MNSPAGEDAMTQLPDDGLVGLRPVNRGWPIGVVPNAQQQDAKGFMPATNYKLAIVEFDDQGRGFLNGNGEREQLDTVSAEIEAMRENGVDAIVVVFVHGWQHDARTDDENLTAFRVLLDQTALHERRCADGGKERPVYGIFVGWRGLSLHGMFGTLQDATFWDRQQAGQRVATGSVRELFGRLRHYRNSRQQGGGPALLAIAGHSFGGMIVFSALAQSLIEAASAPADHMIPRFADVVLLVNPAIEGARYLPIYDLVSSAAFQKRTIAQLPAFICVQADNDQPVGTFFPIGNVKNHLEEATIGSLESRCTSHGVGFIDEFLTHRISGPSDTTPFVLEPSDPLQKNPFWVVRATREVVDGHGGIWLTPFRKFLEAILFKHVNVSKAPKMAPAPAAKPVAEELAAPRKAAPESLAEYAATLPDPPAKDDPPDEQP
jgi:hypothetical protein